MKDLFGREYKKFSDTKAGDKIQCDGDFTCLPDGAIRKVSRNKKGDLYIRCSEGMHLLCGQLEHGWLIGIYPVRPHS